jgi:hypothetical protein
MTALTATRRRPEGHGAAPGPGLAPLTRDVALMPPRAVVDARGHDARTRVVCNGVSMKS